MSQGDTYFCDWRQTVFRYATGMTCVCFLCEGNLREMRDELGVLWHHPMNCVCQGRGPVTLEDLGSYCEETDEDVELQTCSKGSETGDSSAT